MRTFEEKDVQQIIGVYQRAFAEPPWNESWTDEAVTEDLQNALRQNNPIILVAEKDGKLVGFRWAYELPMDKFPFLNGQIESEKTMYGDELAVENEYRGMGIGSGMMKLSFELAKKAGYDTFVGRTDANSKMVPVYKRLGYEEMDIRDPKYPNRFYFIKRLN
ncbi:MAG TPA: GNAT family N-acetyltransferase [archaeon]|nr:GNAT family N-acetyltransferase [archaeon]